MNLRAVPVVILTLMFAPIALAQTATQPRVLDQWSGLILLCQVDAKLDVPKDLCDQIYAEAARQAGAANLKLATLAPGDGESGKIAKAKAAGFDDAKAVETLINIHTTSSTTRPATIDIDALSRLHAVPVQVAGKPNMFQKIYIQGANPDPGPDWPRQVVPMVKLMLRGFFEMYSVPAPVKK